MTLGERILKLSAESGKTRADLARFLGTKQSTINGWTNAGRSPSADAIIPICEFFDVSPSYLLTGKNPRADTLGVSPEAAELARRWDALDADGKALVRAELVRAEDRRTKKEGAE